MNAPSDIRRWAVIASRVSVLGACFWFALGGLLYFAHWPTLGGILVGLTSLQVVLAIALAAILRRLRRWPDTPQKGFAVAFAFGLLPIIIAACVIVTGWVLSLSSS